MTAWHRQDYADVAEELQAAANAVAASSRSFLFAHRLRSPVRERAVTDALKAAVNIRRAIARLHAAEEPNNG